MAEYPTPQFIEEEGKIVSFLTFRQFFVLIGTLAVCGLFYYFLPFYLFIILSLITVLIGASIAFLKINNTPVAVIVLNFLFFFIKSKDYTWKKKESPYPFKPIKRAQIKRIEKGPVLQAQTSQLKQTKTAIELRTK